jgi:hypothetical protein
MASIWRGIEAASGKPELNLSQVLSCLAIVNGSPASPSSTDGVNCPTEYAQDLGPIRFVTESEVDSRQPAVETLARVLKDRSANGLVIRLVGHSDFKGSNDAKRAVSLYRAKNLVTVLRQKGVPEGRLVALGRSDSEPFGQTQDQFPVGDKTGKCTLLGKTVNCDRRVSIEIASPLVARYGLLAEGRMPSSLIKAENVPHVRHYPNGLVPGQPYSIDLRKLVPKEKDLGLKWHPNCQSVASKWKEVPTTGSLFDKHAGPIWVRARSRENVDSESGSAQTLVLELAATKSTPEHGKETPLPDYWAVRMRMTNMDDKKIPHRLVPVFESLRDGILGNKSLPACTVEGACKTDPQQLERQRAARACLGNLLVEDSFEIDTQLISQIEGEIPEQLAMHGDDRLAQAFGVNAWAPTILLQPGMELCIGEATYTHRPGNDGVQVTDNANFGCGTLLVNAGGESPGMGFETWITDMTRIFPRFRKPVPGDDIKNSVCGRFSPGTPGRIVRAEQLGCLPPAHAVLLFPHALPQVESKPIVERHMIVTAPSAEKMQAFIQSIEDIRPFGVDESCENNKDVTCAFIAAEKKTPNSGDLASELFPRLRVNLVASELASPAKPFPLASRLATLVRQTQSGRADPALSKVSITNQLKLEFGADTVVEQSTQLFAQWPLTAMEMAK